MEEVIKRVEIAKSAARDKLVALDIGPLGQLMEPYGTLSFEAAYEAFKAGCDRLLCQADIILIETMSDVYEAKAAILAARENSDLPVICTMTFQQDGSYGNEYNHYGEYSASLGVAALGLNCSWVQNNAGLEQILLYSRFRLY